MKIYTINIEGIIGYKDDEDKCRLSYSYEDLKQNIEELGKFDYDELMINIRSKGGSAMDALLIYDALMELDMPITTRCFGYVASAATIIAQAASNGKRLMSENSLYLIHCSTAETGGNIGSIQQTDKLLSKTDSVIAGIYKRHSTMAQDYLAHMELNNRDGEWLTAEEALEYGLIDEIMKR